MAAEEEEIEKSYEERARDEDYLEFRRTLDRMRSQRDGMRSEAENLKNQGNNFFTFGCYVQAASMYSEAIELNPGNPVLYCNRAMTYLKMNMAEEALLDAEKSLQLDSSKSNIKAHWRKAQALLDLGRDADSEAAADVGLEIEPKNGYINRVRRKAREASTLKQLAFGGEWVGKLHGGVEQRLTYSMEGTMTMNIFGHTVTATFDLSVEGHPRSMVVKMTLESAGGPGSGAPPPPVPYIFKFHEEELWLCHPVEGSQELPTEFEGPGFVRMTRAAVVTPLTDEEEQSLDVRVASYMAEMNKLLPVMPQQLPEKPSDDAIRMEVQIAEGMAGLRRRYGIEVHRQAVDYAKAPETAPSELFNPSREFQKRLLARKLIELPPLPPTVAQTNSTTAALAVASPAVEAAPSAVTTYAGPAPAPVKESPCFGGLIAMICGGKSS
eukprot:gnl/TRDRNA2_/TRDRNA2_182099_c0_seq1.p1 gnl/TRDRNA2_/TRDRNA2_182099_c0~~gnl/TRDRNA2_/TRDRNA2_182099_c0_seq1.p1  ORF type:complete len:438 (-),score=97.65 gnl/TRDRNA2_/TRDRNA2_182099_c0_seq1:108-1421(-)